MMLSVWLGVVLLPFYASAYTIPNAPPAVLKIAPKGNYDKNAYVCSGSDPTNPDRGLTARLIPCIRDAVIYASANMIIPFNEYFSGMLSAVFTLAIVTFGVSIMLGNSAGLTRNGFVLLIKIGAIIWFYKEFPLMYPKMLNALEDILNILARPLSTANPPIFWKDAACTIPNFQASEQNIMTIWGITDCYIELLIGGIFSQATIASGLIGFVVGCALSTSAGLFIALLGIYVIIMALLTIARATYVFLTAYIAFSFMIIISSIFIPCILFKSTKRYFDSWLEITISFLIQPIFLFGYMVMFLVAFNSTVFNGKHSLYYVISGHNAQDLNFKLGDWLNFNGAYSDKIINKEGVAVDRKIDSSVIGGLNNNNNITGSEAPVKDINIDRDKTKMLLLGGNKALAFFEEGREVKIIDWDILTQKAEPTKWGNAITKDDKNIVVQKYKIRVFVAFLMTAMVIYIFYSLLAYLPYIGSSVTGGGGLTLGAGMIAAPTKSLAQSGGKTL